MPRETRTLLVGDAETCIEQKNIFSALVPEVKPPELPPDIPNPPELPPDIPNPPELPSDIPNPSELPSDIPNLPEPLSNTSHLLEPPSVIPNPSFDGMAVPLASKESDTVSNSRERKMPSIKIRVRQSAATSRAEEIDNQTFEKSQGGQHETDHGASSSVSVDAPQRNLTEAVSINNQILEEVNSCHDHGSRLTASIGSAKPTSDGDEIGKELQCTADSSKVSVQVQTEVPLSSSFAQDNNLDADAHKYVSLQTLSVGRHGSDGGSLVMMESSRHGKEKSKKKDKEKKRKRGDHKGHRDDPEYLERKRLKEEKKRKEKEMAKLLKVANSSSVEPTKKEEPRIKSASVQLNPKEPSASDAVTKRVDIRQLNPNEPRADDTTKKVDVKPEASEGTSAAPKIRIRLKTRTLNKL